MGASGAPLASGPRIAPETSIDEFADRGCGLVPAKAQFAAQEAPRCMLPELIGVARAWSADLIVRESLEFAGCVAAEALGLPHASVAAAADSALDRRRELAGPLAGLRQQAGLPADPDGDMAFRHLHLCFTPPGFDGPEARFPPAARFFAHHPSVLVSMGTVFHRTPGLHGVPRRLQQR